jgi:phosphate transport system substrate-binding protein
VEKKEESQLMRRSLILLAVLALCATPALAGVVIKGSDTVLPLSQKEAEVFLEANPKVSISVIGGGSGVGIAAMLDGTCDIAQTSRPIKTKEKKQAESKDINPVQTVIAKDAITVVVNPENPVSKLTVEQIGKIFTGETKNWKDVGGADMEIVVYSRESSSGTYAFFREHVLGGNEYASSALLAPATGAIVQSVSQTKGAVGYIGMAYMTDSVKSLAVAQEAGVEYISATPETALEGTYPISRDLYYYTNGAPKGETKTFMDFVLSPEGQKLVADVGYVPVKPVAGSSE